MKYDGHSLKYAILGLLSRQSLTGYDISREFEKNINKFWTAKHSQIYPELKKLLEQELVTCEIQISGEILEKKVYTITDKGRDVFIQWLKTDEKIENPPKDVFRLRTYFSDILETEVKIQLLASQISQHKERLEHLEQKYQKYSEPPHKSSPLAGDYLLLDNAIRRERAQIEWLEDCVRYYSS